MKHFILLFSSLLFAFSTTIAQPYILTPTTTGGTKGAGGILHFNLGTNAFENITSINSLNPSLDLDGSEFFGITQGDNTTIYVTTLSGGDYDEGALFSYDLKTGNVAMLYSFGIDGEFGIPLPNNPRFKPLHHNGSLYGVTRDGGDYGWGAVYKYDLSTDEMSFLVHFNNEHLQSSPLIVGENDNTLYGTSTSGNGHAKDTGTIYGVNLSNNTIFRVYNFYDDYIGGMYRPWGPIVMHGDEIYGTTKKNEFRGFSGGIYAYNIVKKEFRVVLKILETDVEGTTYQGITKTSFNQLYATALGGGAKNGGVLQYIEPSAHNSEIKYAFPYDGWMESIPTSLNGVLYGIRDYKAVHNNSGWSVIYKIEDASSNSPSYSELYTIDKSTINAYDYIITDAGLMIGGYSTLELNGSGGLFSFDVNSGEFKNLIEFKTNGGNTLSGEITKINDSKYYVSAQTGAKSDQGAILKYNPSIDGFSTVEDAHYAYSFNVGGQIAHSNSPSTRHYINSEGKFIFSSDLYNRKQVNYYAETRQYYEYYRGAFTAIDTAGDHKTGSSLQMKFKHERVDDQGNFYNRHPYYTNISLLEIDGDTALVFVDNRIGKVNTKTFENFGEETFINDVDTYGENFGDHMILAQNNLVYGMMRKKGTNNLGTLFSYDYQTKAMQSLHQFDSLTGSSPSSGLLEASDGNLYGMTSLGGNFNKGVLFKYDINSSQLSVLKHFDGDTDGGHPKGGLLEDNGVLYGVTFDGGSHHLGTLFKFTTNTSSYEVLLNLDKNTGGHPLNTIPIIDCIVPGITSLALDPSSVNCTGNALTFNFKTIRGNSNQWNLPTNTSIISQSDTTMTLDISNLSIGKYTLDLSNTNSCGSSTPVTTNFEKVQSVSIDTIKTQQSITCKIAFANFEMDGVQLADSYRWKIPNGAVVVGDNDKHKIQLSLQGIGFGDHTLTAYVENSCGSIDSTEYHFTIDVYNPSEIDFTFTPYSETTNHQIDENIYCSDKISGVITYDNRPSNISQMMWDFPHKDTRIKDVSHVNKLFVYPWNETTNAWEVYNQNDIEVTLPLKEGPNQIRVWGYDACGGSSLINTDTIYYYTPYAMSGIKTANNNVCAGQEINLEAEFNGGYGFDFEWILPNAVTLVSHGISKQPSLVFNEGGTFTIGVTTKIPSNGTSCNLSTDTAFVDITVKEIKKVLLTGTNAICGNSSELIKVYAENHDDTPLLWTYPNEAIKVGTSNNDTLVLDVSMLTVGDFQISVKGQGNCFSSSPTFYTFNIHDGNVITDRLELSETAGCYDNEFSISAVGTKNVANHHWIYSGNVVPSGDTNLASLSFHFADDTYGVETIKYVASNGCHISDTLSLTVNVNNSPVIEGIDLPSELCKSSYDTLTVSILNQANTVSWTLPTGAVIVDSLSLDQIVVNFTSVADGDHEVSVNASNDCGNSNTQTANVRISNCIVSAIISLEQELSIYPNPSSDFMEIKNLPIGQYEYSIVDTKGSVIVPKHQFDTKNIDIRELKSGNYFIRVINGGEIIYNAQFIKK
ncbi:T9SS type A sorting domain-containing protein [Flammeovirga pectinis]|uniref:T9SS type A sorting domain-containing protein n=1 Tax=Flammeovirga pectinis TaxID=2494373 RepID=A0A3S9P2A9_9BACT|nr:choice-of-anchor tandem repeat GloVer-containing protein [Flammeovirga pectinis]AZQ62302.1 T9SS type A sorting domain-containing protein [Flammeovirga pectinis]